jgi:peroxiredoxin/glutaredoxin
MSPIQEGQQVPNVNFRFRVNGEWKDVSTQELFSGKTVVVFSLPGAFTPTCSGSHVPRYNQLVPAFEQAGVDAVLCVSVNDAFVMDAWQAEQKADRLTFVPDGNGDFSRGMGLLVTKNDLGFGERSWRYSMLVKDGVIEKLFIEPEKPGDPFEVSDADTMLQHLGGTAPQDVIVFTRANCGHCRRAKALLQANGLDYAEVPATPGMLKAVSGRQSTPQVFIGGQHIGGADDLEQWFRSQNLKVAA